MISVLQRVWFRVALFAWAGILPTLCYKRDLKSVIALVNAPARAPYSGLPAGYIIFRVKRATRRPWFMRDRRCLREGVLAYRFLKLAGFEPEVHFGVDRASVSSIRLQAHCWVILDGHVVLNPPEPSMVEILVLRNGSDGTTQFENFTVAGGSKASLV